MVSRKLTAQSFLLGISCPALVVYALPENAHVKAGQVQVSAAGSRLEVRQQSDRAVIDWGSFNVAAGEIVRFVQPERSAWTLNRDTSGSASHILGNIQANGGVFLLNSQGILVGEGARLDVGSLVLTTAEIENSDGIERLMSGAPARFSHSAGALGAKLLNQGQINVESGGFVGLIGVRVENQGRIVAQGGEVVLSSARSFYVDFTGDGLLQFETHALPIEGAQIIQAKTGDITAQKVMFDARHAEGILDRVINLDGVVRARDLHGNGGRIVLKAGAGHAVISGVLNAAAQPGQPRASGGSVDAFGAGVLLRKGAKLRASGNAKPGRIRIGGDYRGGSASLPKGVRNASQVLLQSGVVLENSLATEGLTLNEGARRGSVIVWSDHSTRFFGSINAGDTGLVEISGKHHLDLGAKVRVRAGELLLDPDTILWDAAATVAQNTQIANNTLSLDEQVTDGSATITINRNIWSQLSGTNAVLNLQAKRIIIKGDVSPPISVPAKLRGLSLSASKQVIFSAGSTLSGSALTLLEVTAGENISVGLATLAPAGMLTLASGRKLDLNRATLVADGVRLSAGDEGLFASGARVSARSGAMLLSSSGNVSLSESHLVGQHSVSVKGHHVSVVFSDILGHKGVSVSADRLVGLTSSSMTALQGKMIVSSERDITISGGIISGGVDVDVTLSAKSIIHIDGLAGTVLGDSAISAPSLDFNNFGGFVQVLELLSLTSDGDITLTAIPNVLTLSVWARGNITALQPLTVFNLAALSALSVNTSVTPHTTQYYSINLAHSANSMNTVQAVGSSINLTSGGSATLAGITAGQLNVRSAREIRIASGITVSGAANFEAFDVVRNTTQYFNIGLSHSLNRFATVSAKGKDVRIRDAQGGLLLGPMFAAGALEVRSAGDLSAANSDINAGRATLSAAADIAVTRLSTTAGGRLRAADDIVIATLQGAATWELNADSATLSKIGALSLLSISVTKGLSVIARGGFSLTDVIYLSGAIGTLYVSAQGGVSVHDLNVDRVSLDIKGALNSGGSVNFGTLLLSAASAELSDSDALVLSTISVVKKFGLTAATGVVANHPITAGTVNISAASMTATGGISATAGGTLSAKGNLSIATLIGGSSWNIAASRAALMKIGDLKALGLAVPGVLVMGIRSISGTNPLATLGGSVGTLSLSSAGTVSLTQLLATGISLQAGGALIGVGTVRANGSAAVYLQAGGSMVLQHLIAGSAGGTLSAVGVLRVGTLSGGVAWKMQALGATLQKAGAISLSGVFMQGNLDLEIKDSGEVFSYIDSSAFSVTVRSDGHVSVHKITAAAVGFSVAGTLAMQATLSASGAVDISAATAALHSTSIMAGSQARLWSGGDLSMAMLGATSAVSVRSGGAVQIARISSGGLVSVDSTQSLSLDFNASISAGGGVTLNSKDAIVLANASVSVNGALALSAGSSVQIGTQSSQAVFGFISAHTLLVAAGGSVALGTIAVNTSATAQASGDLWLRGASVLGDVSLSSTGNINLSGTRFSSGGVFVLAATGRVIGSSIDVAGHTVLAGVLSVSAQGGALLNTVVVDSKATVHAGGGLTLGHMSVSKGDLSISTSGVVSAGGFQAGGDLDVYSGGALSVSTAASVLIAAGNITLRSDESSIDLLGANALISATGALLLRAAGDIRHLAQRSPVNNDASSPIMRVNQSLSLSAGGGVQLAVVSVALGARITSGGGMQIASVSAAGGSVIVTSAIDIQIGKLAGASIDVAISATSVVALGSISILANSLVSINALEVSVADGISCGFLILNTGRSGRLSVNGADVLSLSAHADTGFISHNKVLFLHHVAIRALTLNVGSLTQGVARVDRAVQVASLDYSGGGLRLGNRGNELSFVRYSAVQGDFYLRNSSPLSLLIAADLEGRVNVETLGKAVVSAPGILGALSLERLNADGDVSVYSPQSIIGGTVQAFGEISIYALLGVELDLVGAAAPLFISTGDVTSTATPALGGNILLGAVSAPDMVLNAPGHSIRAASLVSGREVTLDAANAELYGKVGGYEKEIAELFVVITSDKYIGPYSFNGRGVFGRRQRGLDRGDLGGWYQQTERFVLHTRESGRYSYYGQSEFSHRARFGRSFYGGEGRAMFRVHKIWVEAEMAELLGLEGEIFVVSQHLESTQKYLLEQFADDDHLGHSP